MSRKGRDPRGSIDGRSKSVDISAKAIDQLSVEAEVKEVLKDIQSEVAEAYREGFVEMVQAIRQQASALDRIQATLAILVKHLAPALEAQIPAAMRVARDGETPDVATAVVVADPIGAGFTMSQANVAKALGINQADASVLLRAFHLNKDSQCAVVVRPGDDKRQAVVNYHPRTLDRFHALTVNPPGGLDGNQKRALRRARARMGTA
jgi:hypothetical protein